MSKSIPIPNEIFFKSRRSFLPVPVKNHVAARQSVCWCVMSLPKYSELPVSPFFPENSSWGLWGKDDQLGCINLLTPQVILKASSEIKTGKSFSLNLRLELPDPPLFGRAKLKHACEAVAGGAALDDLYDNFNTQSSSHWAALRHFPHPVYGNYNDMNKKDEEHPQLGIEHWARRGIVGRAVLLDFGRWATTPVEQGGGGLAGSFSPRDGFAITAEHLQKTAEWQGVKFEIGDILLIRTGWLAWYETLSKEERVSLAEDEEFATIGLEASDQVVEFLWNNHFSAIACDNPTVEVWPPSELESTLHGRLLALLGMPLGELFDLESLSKDCADDKRYYSFFTSAPLNKKGGVASPPNALAIK